MNTTARPGTTEEVPIFISERPLGDLGASCETITIHVYTRPLPSPPPAPVPASALQTPVQTANLAQFPTSILALRSSPPPLPARSRPVTVSQVEPQPIPTITTADVVAGSTESGEFDEEEEIESEQVVRWDYCLMLPVDDGSGRLGVEGEAILKAIDHIGIKTKCVLNGPEDTMVCFLGMTLRRLEEVADELDYVLPLDPNALRNRVEKGWPAPLGLSPEAPNSIIVPTLLATADQFHVAVEETRAPEKVIKNGKTLTYLADYTKANIYDPSVSSWEPFQWMHGKYDSRQRLQELFLKPEGNHHPFGDLTRINLIFETLQTLKV